MLPVSFMTLVFENVVVFDILGGARPQRSSDAGASLLNGDSHDQYTLCVGGKVSVLNGSL